MLIPSVLPDEMDKPRKIQAKGFASYPPKELKKKFESFLKEMAEDDPTASEVTFWETVDWIDDEICSEKDDEYFPHEVEFTLYPNGTIVFKIP